VNACFGRYFLPPELRRSPACTVDPAPELKVDRLEHWLNQSKIGGQ
jgi:hypothetical protein